MTADRFRLLVSGVLIVGVVTSAALLVAGLAGAIAVGWSGSLAGGPPAGGAVADFGAMGANLAALRPTGFAQLGLVVLLGTPVARVAASVAAFALEGDRLYAAITTVVLVVLLASLFVLR
ncbi:MAG: DUF1634 domain-containing protein [Chloroflexota bacterium]